MTSQTWNVAAPATWMALLPRLAEIGLVLLLAWITAGIFTGGEPSRTPADVDATGQGEGEAAVDVAAVLKATPFGELAAIPKPMVRAPTVAAPSKLNIKLHGTVVAGDESAAMVVSRPGAKLEVYHVGETILPGVTLSAVEAMRIVVKTASGFEEIWMEEAAGAALAPPQQGRPAAHGIIAPGNSKSQKSQQRVSRGMLDKELSDLGKLMTQVRVTPYFENGQSAGFQLQDIAAGSIFERIGLQEGDVLQSINGQSLTDPQQAIAMYEQLRSGNNLDVVLKRNKQAQTIQYLIQ